MVFRRTFWLGLSSILLAGLSLAASASARAAEPPISLDAYWQKLEETRALAGSLRDATPEDSGPALRAAADEWARLTAVVLPGGAAMPLDHSWLTAALRADPPDPARVQALIETHLATRETWPTRATSPKDLTALSAILSRPEFQWATPEPSWLERILQRLQEWFWRWLGKLLSRRGGVGANSPLAYILAGVLVVMLALVLGLALRGLLANLVAETEAPADPHAGDENLTAQAALQRAQSLSGAGDYRAAVRYLYLSALLLLEERGLLRYNRTLTNREYIRSVSHLPGLAAILRDVVEVFDRVWYGYQPLDQAAYAQYAERVADLHKQKNYESTKIHEGTR